MNKTVPVNDVFFVRPDRDREMNVYVIKYRDPEGKEHIVGKAKKRNYFLTGSLEIYEGYEMYRARIFDAVSKKLGIDRAYAYHFDYDGLRIYCDPENKGRFILYDQIDGQKKQIGIIRDKRTSTGCVYASIVSDYFHESTFKYVKEEFGTRQLVDPRTGAKL